MSEPVPIDQIIAAAPPGVIMSGTMHKVLHTNDKTGAVTTHVVMIANVGGQEIRQEMPPFLIEAISGRGPMGKMLVKFLRRGRTELPEDNGHG